MRVSLILCTCLTLTSAACIAPQSAARGELSRLGQASIIEQCEAANGGLSVAAGALFFTPDARPDASGAPQPQPPILIASLSGALSDIIPHMTPGKAILARQALEVDADARVTQPAQLVELELSSLTPRAIWSAPQGAQELRLKARQGQRAVVTWTLTSGDQAAPVVQIASAPLLPQEPATEPLTLSPQTVDASGETPQGATRHVVPDAKVLGLIYVVDAWPDGRLVAAKAQTKATVIERLSEAELLLVHADGTCAVAPMNAPETWALLVPTLEGCQSKEDDTWLRPLIDAAPAPALVAASPPACATRALVPLPPLGPAQGGGLTAPVSLAPLPLATDSRASLRVLIRGKVLAVEFFAEASPLSDGPDWRLALPPEAVSVLPVMLEGQPFHEALIKLDIPVNPWPSCDAGTLRVVVGDDADMEQRAVLEQDVEFGKCAPDEPASSPAATP